MQRSSVSAEDVLSSIPFRMSTIGTGRANMNNCTGGLGCLMVDFCAPHQVNNILPCLQFTERPLQSGQFQLTIQDISRLFFEERSQAHLYFAYLRHMKSSLEA